MKVWGGDPWIPMLLYLCAEVSIHVQNGRLGEMYTTNSKFVS
jgi:hypothetical protein